MTEGDILDEVIKNVSICYDNEQRNLAKIAISAPTEGVIRDAAGKLVENVLQNIINTINACVPNYKIVSKVGSTDYLSKSINYKGSLYSMNTIQVDRHVFSNGKRIAFIENKTYLDSCYYDRALADFRKIIESLSQHGHKISDLDFVVFAGQNAASENTLKMYEADFWNFTRHYTDGVGIEPKTFFFLKGKRSSSHPLYKEKHPLNEENIKDLARLLLNDAKMCS